MPYLTLIDGCDATALPVTDRGLAYGDGLFETLRVLQGQALLFERHWQRLTASARRLNLPLPFSKAQLQQQIRRVSGSGDGVVKLILTRGSGGRGYCPADEIKPRWILQGMPLPLARPEHYRQGVRVRRCSLQLAEQPALAGIKHLNRLEQVMARSEWQDQVFEGLMFSQSGALIEATMANLFLLRQGRLYTPGLEQCGVAGVMRDAIIRVCEGLDPCSADAESLAADAVPERLKQAPVAVTRLTEADLLQADALFLCNGVRGILPVSHWQSDDGAILRRWDWQHEPLVQALMAFFHPRLHLPGG